MPACVEDLWADLAITFHWPLPDLERLGLGKLLEWHERARVRTEVEK
ncbi:MAG: GpE family phage tail protein [Betaproteobacteria bacterium]|nr:GpE family phage tail protein [Betaproteobacteria bacterium]